MRSRGLPLCLIALCGGLSGCDLPQNLGDLGGSLMNPDAELLETPGRRLAAGQYSRLELDGSLESGGWVIAKRHDLEEEAVSIISFQGDGQCELDGAADFQRVSSRVDVALPGIIAFQGASGPDGPGEVRFAGFDCEPRLEPVGSSALPSMPFPRSAPIGLLMLTATGELLLADATRQVLHEVATNVRSGSSEGDRLWLFEGPEAEAQLVVYDLELEPVASWEGVSELLVLGWHEPNAVVRDAEGLHFVTVSTGERELIDAHGCSAVSVGSQVVAYFAPCEERHLRLSVPGSLVGREEDRFTIDIGPGAMAPSEIIPFWQGKNSFVIYQVNPQSGAAQTGELRVAERLGEDPEVRQGSERTIAPASRVQRANIFLDWDGVSGTLVTPQLKVSDRVTTLEGLQVVAEKVAQLPGGDLFSERGVLLNYDGSVGELVRFHRTTREDGSYDSTLLGAGVPIQTQSMHTTTGTFAFVGDFEGESGTAYLVSGGALRAVGDRALPGTLRFLEQPQALAYLAHDGSGGATATLRAWLIDAELSMSVSDNVSEFRELPWPSAGLLYAVPRGERSGIWFARAR